MPRNRTSVPDPFAHPTVDNDPLGAHDTGEWGLPSQEGIEGQQPAHLPPAGFDYSGGIFVGHDHEADAQPPPASPHMIRARVDAPHSFDLPHPALHRRYEPPFVVPISQGAAGFSVIATTLLGLHYVKLLALNLTLDAAGTVKFVQGSNDGTGTADMTGAMAMGGAAAPMLNLAPAPLDNPWLFTSPDLAFGIFTTVGKAQGWALIAFSPYDS